MPSGVVTDDLGDSHGNRNDPIVSRPRPDGSVPLNVARG